MNVKVYCIVVNSKKNSKRSQDASAVPMRCFCSQLSVFLTYFQQLVCPQTTVVLMTTFWYIPTITILGHLCRKSGKLWQ